MLGHVNCDVVGFAMLGWDRTSLLEGIAVFLDCLMDGAYAVKLRSRNDVFLWFDSLLSYSVLTHDNSETSIYDYSFLTQPLFYTSHSSLWRLGEEL